jgi:hypothetical protein
MEHSSDVLRYLIIEIELRVSIIEILPRDIDLYLILRYELKYLLFRGSDAGSSSSESMVDKV